MNQDYFKSWAALVTEMHKPFQAMMELNLKTLQNLHYAKPEEASSWQQPHKMIDHQMKMAMENSHQMLDYMRQSFQILENAFAMVSKEMRRNSELAVGRAKSAMPGNKAKNIPIEFETSTTKNHQNPRKHPLHLPVK